MKVLYGGVWTMYVCICFVDELIRDQRYLIIIAFSYRQRKPSKIFGDFMALVLIVVPHAVS